MNARLLVPLLGLTLIVGGAIAVASTKPHVDMKKSVGVVEPAVIATPPSTVKSPAPTTAAAIHPGEYSTYDAAKLARANGGKVVIFFAATWCETCQALDQNIKSSLGSIPSNVTILNIDYDKSTKLKQKYGVTFQHTLVQVDANGNLLKKWDHSPTLAALVGQII